MTAQTETTKKAKQVSTTIAPEKYAALEDYRWSNRVNKLSEVISEAVDAFITAKGLTVEAPATEETPAKSAK